MSICVFIVSWPFDTQKFVDIFDMSPFFCRCFMNENKKLEEFIHLMTNNVSYLGLTVIDEFRCQKLRELIIK